jgi:hypothetical protein
VVRSYRVVESAAADYVSHFGWDGGYLSPWRGAGTLPGFSCVIGASCKTQIGGTSTNPLLDFNEVSYCTFSDFGVEVDGAGHALLSTSSQSSSTTTARDIPKFSSTPHTGMKRPIHCGCGQGSIGTKVKPRTAKASRIFSARTGAT